MTRTVQYTQAGRPIINGVPATLTSNSPEAWWVEEAQRLGLPVEDLKQQVALADTIIAEVLSEEEAEAILAGKNPTSNRP